MYTCIQLVYLTISYNAKNIIYIYIYTKHNYNGSSRQDRQSPVTITFDLKWGLLTCKMYFTAGSLVLLVVLLPDLGHTSDFINKCRN